MNMHARFTQAVPDTAVRQPTVAGRFYPEDPEILRHDIREFLAHASPANIRGRLVALIAPHAGYAYSGGVAAHAYQLLQQHPAATLIVIAPSHFEKFPFVSVFNGRSYRTPLGELAVNRLLAEKLLQCEEVFVPAWKGHRDRGGRAEHALEVQLPFLQVISPQCEIVPLVMGDQSWDLCEALGNQLARLAVEATFVIVASSDLSHYHTQETAQQLDGRFMDLLTGQNAHALYEAVARRQCEACGAGPVIATMLAAEQLRARQVEVLRYETSGEVSGDFSRVVGYLAASFSQATHESACAKTSSFAAG